MLISTLWFYTIPVLAFITGSAAAFFLLRRRSANAVFLTGIFSGALFYTLMIVFSNKLIVIDESLQVSHYHIIGSFSERLSGGRTVGGSFEKNHFGVLNRSDRNMVIEEIVYQHASDGAEATRTGDYLIPAGSYREIFLPENEIMYYFGEEIPVEVESGSRSESRYWLHAVGEEG